MPRPSATPSAPDPTIARVAVEVAPYHLDRTFDYLVGDASVETGQLVQVRFAGRRVRGLVIDVAGASDVEPSRLRTIERVLGPHVWARGDDIALFRWAADRFGASLGDVLRHALPRRVIDVERRAGEQGWFPPAAIGAPWTPTVAPDTAAWQAYVDVGNELRKAVVDGQGSFFLRPLPGEDLAARLIDLVDATLCGGRDAVVIVPDRASPVGARIAAHFDATAIDLRGDRSPRIQYRRWLEARCGRARVVVGERGAAFLPVEHLGLAVVVDEANPALKERRSPRHHAREVMLERARRAGGVGLLTGTVPSALAWRLLRDQRLHPIIPTRDAERARRPQIRIVDWQRQPRTRLARESLAALRNAHDEGTYGIVLATRRGEGRFLVCRRCATRTSCPRCASTLARHGSIFRCAGCGWHAPNVRCASCHGTAFVPVAAGTSWLATEIRRSLHVPTVALEGYDPQIPPPPATLVVTRGTVLDTPPGPIGAIILGDVDASLRRPTLDAAEDTLRLAMAIAAWTMHPASGVRGDVIVQTREPEHPAVVALQRWDPAWFWTHEAPARSALGFPPARYAIRLVYGGDDDTVTDDMRAALPDADELLGPIQDEGRQEFLIKSHDRRASLEALHALRIAWSSAGVDVRVDVDPVDAW
ncbi:MAG: hypothetical protein WD011_06810 [Nitriliruptoraceae bacterium]